MQIGYSCINAQRYRSIISSCRADIAARHKYKLQLSYTVDLHASAHRSTQYSLLFSFPAICVRLGFLLCFFHFNLLKISASFSSPVVVELHFLSVRDDRQSPVAATVSLYIIFIFIHHIQVARKDKQTQ